MLRRLALALSLSLLLTPLCASAQTLPQRPLRLVVGFPAGSTTDVVARVLAQGLGNQVKQSVIVENRPGAASMIAATNVVQSAPDGTSLLFGTLPTLSTGTLNEKLPIDPQTDLTPVAQVVSAQFMLIAAADTPAANLAEFMRVLKANPARYSFGSSGNGSTIHLAAELFNRGLGVTVLYVPYKGTSEVVQDLLGKKITYAFAGLENLQHVKTGALKAYALSGLKRDPAAPDLPTIGESALPGYAAATTMLVFGPRGMARPLVEALNQATNRAAASDEFTQKIRSLGGMLVISDSTPDSTRNFVRDEIARWDAIVKTMKIKS